MSRVASSDNSLPNVNKLCGNFVNDSFDKTINYSLSSDFSYNSTLQIDAQGKEKHDSGESHSANSKNPNGSQKEWGNQQGSAHRKSWNR